jgi:hypothetical protein
MDHIDSIATYLRLCGRPHKRKYSLMSFGSCTVVVLSRGSFVEGRNGFRSSLMLPSSPLASHMS